MGPYILHIETSTKICSVALSNGPECLAIAEDFEGDHTKVLNSLIRKVLEQSNLNIKQLDAIAVNEGPGSYTALRIGVVSAKGMCYALDKPLIMIPGLKIIASAARNLLAGFEYYISLVDARRDEVYMAIYDKSLDECFPAQAIILNNELSWSFRISDQPSVMAGSGATKWSQFVDNWQPKLASMDISSIHMFPLALEKFLASSFTNIDLAKPFYLKLPNITTPKEKIITR